MIRWTGIPPPANLIASSRRQRANAETIHCATGRIEIKSPARCRKLYSALPARVQQLARKNYQLWQDDESHPSLGFKRLKGGSGRRFSLRVGDHYRAVGQQLEDGIERVWIGSHEDYNKL